MKSGINVQQARLAQWLFLIYCLIVLGGCGAPTYRTEVIETPETRELKGWEKPYKVNGERYDPLRSEQGFVQEGVASWYGRDFHGKLTSNGETYNMNAMTAAHKTLPLGVYVKVTNLENGKSAVVRVNDRGPFVKKRVIDLSYAGAKALGYVDAGTARVKIEALGYQANAKSASGATTYQAPASYDVGSFTIQVGAFTNQQNAVQLKERMQAQYGASAMQKAVVNGRTFFKVRAGKFTSLEAAEAARDRMEQEGFANCFVVAMQ